MKRYVRNIALDEIDFEGQEKMNNTTALVVGAGGLGSHTLYHLASFGFKNLIIMDDDTVSISNLQRQIMFNESSVGKNKALEAAKTINKYNSEVSVYPIQSRFESLDEILNDWKMSVDIIFDCTDNFDSRFLISKESQKHSIPTIFSAVTEFQGWVFPQLYLKTDCQLIENIFERHDNDLNCESLGVVSPSVSFVSSIQAMEGLKLILGVADPDSYYLDVNCFTYQVTQMEF